MESSKTSPDIVSYTSVIRAWGNSGISSPFNHVVENFQSFLATDENDTSHNTKNGSRRPDRIILATMLQALGKEKDEKLEALEQVAQVFEIINEYRVALSDDALFVLAIDTTIQLTENDEMRDKRKDFIATIFDNCCSHGLVSRRLLDKLERISRNGDISKDWIRIIKYRRNQRSRLTIDKSGFAPFSLK